MNPDSPRESTDPAPIEDLLSDIHHLRETTTTDALREELDETEDLLVNAHDRGLIESRVRRLDHRDAAEAIIGSIVFASPLLVEDGVFDIADHLFRYTVGGIPIFLVANIVFVVFMTHALLEWTGRDRLETHRLFGIISMRLIMILGLAFTVATGLMIVWGRVGPWISLTESFARINVLWTVGALGASLGDLVSNNDTSPQLTSPGDQEPPPDTVNPEQDPGCPSDVELVTELHHQLDALDSVAAESSVKQQIRAVTRRTETAIHPDRWFDARIRKYTSRDMAEAFVGSVFFSIPLLVEDGVFDVADYFLSFRIGEFPIFFILNAAFVVASVAMLVYWAGPQNVDVTRPLFGIIPRRLLGITVVSFLTVAALMTMYGRVGNWADPIVAIARISAVWTVAAFGAALGDILPGESSGADINDALGELSETVETFIE